MGPEKVLRVTAENGKLFVHNIEGISEKKAELFLESVTDFFLTVADPRIGFLVDGNGSVNGLILRDGPVETRAVKIN